MIADPVAQRRLLDLQELDTQLAQARHRRQTLPEHTEAADAKSRYDQLVDALTAAQTQLADITGEQTRLERDIAPVRERLAKSQATVDGGTVSDGKTLSALLEDIERMKQRISDLEDQELEVMERVENATVERDRIAAEQVKAMSILREVVGRRGAKLAEVDAEIAQMETARATVAADIPTDLLATYEKIAPRHNGVGVGFLEGRRCSGCRLEANPSDYAAYLAAAPEMVLRCAECDRLLVR